MQTETATSLTQINWDFTVVKTNHSTHGLHPYPAKYIPQIPAALIEELSNPQDSVADIFCGSRTTLVEALASSRNGVGVNANPLACLISKRGQQDWNLRMRTTCSSLLRGLSTYRKETNSKMMREIDIPFGTGLSPLEIIAASGIVHYYA